MLTVAMQCMHIGFCSEESLCPCAQCIHSRSSATVFGFLWIICWTWEPAELCVVAAQLQHRCESLLLFQCYCSWKWTGFLDCNDWIRCGENLISSFLFFPLLQLRLVIELPSLCCNVLFLCGLCTTNRKHALWEFLLILQDILEIM